MHRLPDGDNDLRMRRHPSRNCDLFYIQYVDGEVTTEIVDKDCGPSNIMVVNEADRDIIVAANHTGNEAAVYIVED